MVDAKINNDSEGKRVTVKMKPPRHSILLDIKGDSMCCM